MTCISEKHEFCQAANVQRGNNAFKERPSLPLTKSPAFVGKESKPSALECTTANRANALASGTEEIQADVSRTSFCKTVRPAFLLAQA